MLANKKHQAFVDNYFLGNFNATRAYMETYGVENERAAAASASKLLTIPNIAQEIKTRFQARAMSADEVIDRLSQIGRGDIGDYIDDYGAIDIGAARKAKKTHLLKKVKQRTIRKMEGTEDIEIHDVEFETYSSHEALKDLGKLHSLFVDRKDITSGGKTIEVILRGRDDE